MRLTGRDRHILETIHAFDGMMSLKQIDHLFFSGKGRTQPRHRMRTLHTNGFVNMPGRSAKHQVPIGETIYWLARKGAAVVATGQGKTLKEGFSWRQKPRFSLIAHDLKVNDFRISVREAAAETGSLTLTRWMRESEFWADLDKVTYRDGKGRKRERGVRPDGLFMLQKEGNPNMLAYLLEIDMSTEDNPRFLREKVRPGVAYLGSDAYIRRTGLRYGRWLVVTTGQKRLQNMKRQAERGGGSGSFFFTTFDKLSAESVLTQPVWELAGSAGAHAIVPAS